MNSAGSPRPCVVGREEERSRLLALLADLRRGQSRALVVHGEAGIGKTTLLDELARAAGALCVLRADGMRGDVDLPWSGLRQLLGPLANDLTCLPAAHAAAMSAALGLGGEAGVADRFAIGAAALALLAAEAERAPVLAIVDDFQWLDGESADALAFAAGRLEAEGVGIVIGFRDGEDERARPLVPHLRLDQLDDRAATALASTASPCSLTPELVRDVVRMAAGNPLALVELPAALIEWQRAGGAALDDELPVADSIRDVYGRRLASLSDEERLALAVAAAHHGPLTDVVTDAVARVGVSPDALASAVRAGLLDELGAELRFRHPLARAAVRAEVDGKLWRRANRALADAFEERGELDVVARHLAHATCGPDESVARALERQAHAARQRGALSTAVELATRAARLSPDPCVAARRRIDAAEVAVIAGSADAAGALLTEVNDEGLDTRAQARAAHIRGRHLVLIGRTRKAMFLLRDSAARIDQLDPTASALMLIEASAAANHAGELSASVEMAERARELTHEGTTEAAFAAVALGAALVASGRREESVEFIARYPELLVRPDFFASAIPMLMATASGLVWLERFDEAIEFLDPLISHARRSGALGALPLALVLKGWAHQRLSAPIESEAALVESLQLAEELGQSTIALQARATLCALYAAQLRGAEVRAHAAAVRRQLPRDAGGSRIGATMSLGGILMHEGRLDEAVSILREVADPDQPGMALDLSTYHAAFVHLADTYLRLGRHDEARKIALLLETTGRERGIDWTLGHAHRLLGILADDDSFEWHFERARELLWRFPGVRTWLETSWGERLRACGRESAREHLRSALREARTAGVRWWTDRAASSLSALGEPTILVAPRPSAALNAGEVMVAVAFARLRSIGDVAADLFITPQTVERRLAEAHRKLGTHTTNELAAALSGAGRPEAAGVVVRVLGGLAVECHGDQLSVPSGVPGRLLQIVAIEGGRAPVDVVIERLWPDEGAGSGRSRLRNVLARLRASIGEVVVRDGESLAFAKDVVVDVREFEAATSCLPSDAREAAAHAAEALRWYRGELLPEAAYEPWAAGPRERFRQRYLRALDVLIGVAEQQDEWDEAVRLLELAIEAEPYEEERYLRAAEARLRQERRSSAAALLRRGRAVAAELGVAPSPRLVELEAALAG